MSKSLFKSGVIVSAMTFISRVLGLIRDVVIANLMGAGAAADVFLLCNKIPNFLRRLFAEGAFAQAFVPVLAEIKEKEGEDSMKLFIAHAAGTMGTVLTVVTLLAVIGSPVVIAIFATGWFMEWWNGGIEAFKFELATDLLKITFPYLWFVTLTALSGAVLNVLGRFSVAAFTPVLLNVSVISFALWIAPNMSEPAYGLAWGVFVGGILQLGFQLPFLWKTGMLSRPKWGWNNPQVAKVRTLMLPAIFGVSVSQINLLLDTVIASYLITGSVSWLYFADRLLEFPLGLIGIGIATVILPSLSKQHANQSPEAFNDTLNWASRIVLLLGIPATAGLMLLAEPIIMVLFMSGEFTASDVSQTSRALVAYVSGLVFFMMIKIMAPGFYSRQDTKTPVRFGIIAMLANMVFNLILVFPLAYVGLALATALSGALNAILLTWTLVKVGVFKVSRQTGYFIGKVVVATLVMSAVVFVYAPSFSQWQLMSRFNATVELSLWLTIAIATFVFTLIVAGVRLKDIKD